MAPVTPAALAQALFDEDPDALFLAELPSFRLLGLNRAAARLTGFTPADLADTPVDSLFQTAEPPSPAAASDGTLVEVGSVLRGRSGPVPVEVTTTRLPAAGGAVVLVRARDDRPRRAALDRARRTEARFRALVELSADGILVVEPDGTVRYASPAACRVAGLPAGAIEGRSGFDLVHPEDVGYARGKLAEVVARPGVAVPSLFRVRRADGGCRHVEMVGVNRADDPSVRGVVLNFRDVTGRKRLEDQLRHAHKMEAVGQLAGGVAHDFNNLLTVVLGNAELLRGLVAGPPAEGLVAEIDAAARRAADLTARLLGFARRSAGTPGPVDVARVARDVAEFLGPDLDPRVEVEVSETVGLWPVWADAAQLHQLVTNLCLNARDAMPAGGRLTVAAENVTLDEAAAAADAAARPGRFVRLTVADTGCGMSGTVRERAFEPFFTTKGLGGGAGLGLAVVFGVASAHGGWVACDSEPGAGCRVDVYLPARDGEPTPPPAARPDPPPAAGAGRVLLADDEPMVRELARRALAAHGFAVTEAADGAEAVRLFERAGGGFDLVVLDLSMPNLSGRDALRHIRRQAPGARVVLATGYAETAVTADERAAVQGLLAKPYTPAGLVAAVRAALGPG